MSERTTTPGGSAQNQERDGEARGSAELGGAPPESTLAATMRPGATEDVTPTWRGPLVRQLVKDAATRIDRDIDELHRQRELLSAQLGELTMRRELLDRITSLSDSMLERLVLELGATVPGAASNG